ncbi:MAG: sulfatase-like hydrolase/transferase [Bryobacter sp.]|nr:sulfatase-like hydrolase/transferase [Bryobacter sp.]
MLSRRTLLQAAFQRPTRPNFVVIYTDDQGIGDVGCYGHPEVKTPNLDRLAKTGVRFTNWYTNSPVCSPSRASVFTGKYPERHGITDVLQSNAQFNVPGLKEGEKTLATEMKQLGYRTGHVGKWHMGSAVHSRPKAAGVEDFFGFYSGWTDGWSHRYYTLGKGQSEILHDLWHNEEEVFADPEYQTELLGRKARGFVSAKRGQPFFLNLWFGAPHYPMIAPKQYLERYPATMDRDRRMHLAMVTAVDDQVGMLLDTLEKTGQRENTVVFFQSDNGATQETRADHAGRPYRGGSNAPFRGWKQGLFEGGIRMPAMMSWPGKIPEGKTVDGVGMAMDILPTFLSMAGGSAAVGGDGGVDGRDQSAMVMRGAASAHEGSAVHWVYLQARAVRKGEWKLILNPPKFKDDPLGQPQEKLWLSNLAKDPGETKNWAAGNEAKVRELEKLLPG